MRSGEPIPERIANAPQLLPGLQIYYLAFVELSSCRSGGFSLGPIPWLAIDHYAARHEFEDEQYEDLFHFVQALDSEYIKYKEKK